MRIYYSEDTDPNIIGTIQEMNTLHSELRTFLSSGVTSYTQRTSTSGPSKPFDRLLKGIKFIKADGAVLAKISDDDFLQISASKGNLEIYCDHFAFDLSDDGSHHHPEYVNRVDYIHPNTLSVIIEADDDATEP